MKALLLFTFSLFCLATAAQSVCQPPWTVEATSSASMYCEGAELSLQGTTTIMTNSPLNYRAVWYKAGTTPTNFVFLSNNGLVPSYSMANIRVEDAGYYVLRVEFGTTGSSSCYKEDSVFVKVVKAPEARILSPIAGGGIFYTNQASVDLVANTPSPANAEIGNWTVFGDGSVLSPNSPSTTLQLGNFGDTVKVTWTVDNPICPATAVECRIVRMPVTIPDAGPDREIPLSAAKEIELKGNPVNPVVESASWTCLSPNFPFEWAGSLAIVNFTEPGIYRFSYAINNVVLGQRISDEVIITVTAPLAIEENSDLSKESIFYDKGKEHIVLRNFSAGQVKLVNMQGSLVQELTLSGNEQYVVVAALPKGLYLLHVQTDTGQRICKKVVLD